MLVFVEYEPSPFSSSTSTQHIPLTMARKWQTLALVVLPLILHALAITRYIPEGQETLFGLRPSPTDTNPAASYTGSAAYDPRTLTPPTPPTDPPVNTQFAVQLLSGDIPDLSIRHHGAFLGFSIEFSVSNHVRECSLALDALRVSLIHYQYQWAGMGDFLLNFSFPEQITNAPPFSVLGYPFRS